MWYSLSPGIFGIPLMPFLLNYLSFFKAENLNLNKIFNFIIFYSWYRITFVKYSSFIYNINFVNNFRVSLTLWSVIKIPMFLFLSFFIIDFISSIETGSIPVKGSSSNRYFGLVARVLAISNLRLSPPDKTTDLDFLTWLISNSFRRFCNNIFCLFLSFLISIIDEDYLLSHTPKYWCFLR